MPHLGAVEITKGGKRMKVVVPNHQAEGDAVDPGCRDQPAPSFLLKNAPKK